MKRRKIKVTSKPEFTSYFGIGIGGRFVFARRSSVSADENPSTVLCGGRRVRNAQTNAAFLTGAFHMLPGASLADKGVNDYGSWAGATVDTAFSVVPFGHGKIGKLRNAGRFSSVTSSGRASGARRVTQFFDPSKGDFPIDGRFALSSQPTVGNRIFDGVSETTTFVVPQPANNLSQFKRLFTGVGNRRRFVEFDALPNELVSPGGTKRIFSSVQQTIPGRVDLTGRNVTFGTLGTNYLDYGARYVFVPGTFAAGGYYVYDGVFGDE